MLTHYLQKMFPMSDAKAEQICLAFDWIEMPKNEFLLKEGKISRNTYFLESGYIRSFVLDSEGQEVTTNIYSAPCFVNDFLSFFKQEPANENFQTLTNCRLARMNHEVVQTHFHTIPEFREFGRMMLVTNYSHLHERMLGMIQDSAETRYRKLLAQHSDIFQNLPLKIIASYLGITDTSLSRIRKNAAK